MKLFAHTTPSTDNHDSVLLPTVDNDDDPNSNRPTITEIPQPIFAISHRLIAFASSPPRPASPAQASSRTPRTASETSFDDSTLKFPTTQAELGVAALKIGGSLFSGMKAIGGRAYSAARAGVTAAMAGEQGIPTPAPGPGKFFSRSAPEATTPGRERRYSTASDAASQFGASVRTPEHATVISPSRPGTLLTKDEGHYITVMDLEPLRSSSAPSPMPVAVAEYMVSKHQPVSAIKFSPDGTSLVVALKDGQTMKVYRLRPSARAQKDSATGRIVSQGAQDDDSSFTSPPWHIYDLRRGRTSAIIDELVWADDGRWLAVGTRKRTVHLYALNPYGGPTDEASHLEKRVANVSELVSCQIIDNIYRSLKPFVIQQPLSTELTPLVRLRALKGQPNDRHPPTSTFTFLGTGVALPLSLMPPVALPAHSISSSPSSVHSSSPGQQLEPPGSHEDMLIFDPHDGKLSLRRITLSKRSKDDLSATIRGVAVPSASISLPGVSTLSRIAGSSANLVTPIRQPSALSRMMERSELVARDHVVATWLLKRSVDWKEMRRTFRSPTISRAVSTVRSPSSEYVSTFLDRVSSDLFVQLAGSCRTVHLLKVQEDRAQGYLFVSSILFPLPQRGLSRVVA